MLVAGLTTRRPRIRVTGNAADSQHDAAMLDGVVRVVEHCADDPDLRPQGMAHHFRQPVRGDHLDVVVQQADDLTAGTTGAEVVDRGVVERKRPADHADTWIRSEEHTSELQSLMRISYAVFCLKKK